MANLPIEELRVERARVKKILSGENIKQEVIKDFCRKGQESLGAFEAFYNSGEYGAEGSLLIVLNMHYFWIGEVDGKISEENEAFLIQLGKRFQNCQRFECPLDFKDGGRWDYKWIGERILENSTPIFKSPYNHYFGIVEENPLTYKEVRRRIFAREICAHI